MEKADKILSALFERLNISDSEGYVRLFSTWRSVCDEVSSRGLADHSAIVDVRHGTVIVAVDHSGWLQLIQMQEKRLLGKLQKRFPDMNLKAMHFHITRERVDYVKAGNAENAEEEDPQGGPTDSTPVKSGDREDAAAVQDSDFKDTLGRITDPTLRQTLERLREDLEER